MLLGAHLISSRLTPHDSLKSLSWERVKTASSSGRKPGKQPHFLSYRLAFRVQLYPTCSQAALSRDGSSLCPGTRQQRSSASCNAGLLHECRAPMVTTTMQQRRWATLGSAATARTEHPEPSKRRQDLREGIGPETDVRGGSFSHEQSC